MPRESLSRARDLESKIVSRDRDREREGDNGSVCLCICALGCSSEPSRLNYSNARLHDAKSLRGEGRTIFPNLIRGARPDTDAPSISSETQMDRNGRVEISGHSQVGSKTPRWKSSRLIRFSRHRSETIRSRLPKSARQVEFLAART